MEAKINENLSLTELVNSALVGVGNAPIVDLYDPNDGNAKLCRMLVNSCIREVQSHPSGCWDELQDWEELTLNDTAYMKDVYSYNLPHNSLCILSIQDEYRREVPFRVVGWSLKSPVKAKYVRFVRFSDNPEQWSSELKSCVIGLLSAKMIAAIVKDYNASRQAVEAFWTLEFPRWAGNRINKAATTLQGKDSQLSDFWTGNSNTSLYASDWF